MHTIPIISQFLHHFHTTSQIFRTESVQIFKARTTARVTIPLEKEEDIIPFLPGVNPVILPVASFSISPQNKGR